jgi:hypothetical protein
VVSGINLGYQGEVVADCIKKASGKPDASLCILKKLWLLDSYSSFEFLQPEQS